MKQREGGVPSIIAEDYMNRRMQLLTGQLWKVDGSHKVSTLIASFTNSSTDSGNGEKVNPMKNIFIILNEFEEVIFQQPLLTSILWELWSVKKVQFNDTATF